MGWADVVFHLFQNWTVHPRRRLRHDTNYRRGSKLGKTRAALLASLGTALPSFIIILLIALFFHRLMDVGWIAAMFRGIRPAVVALIAVPTFNMAKSAKITLANCWIPIVTALLIWLLGVNPIYIILAAAVAGLLYSMIIGPTDKTDNTDKDHTA